MARMKGAKSESLAGLGATRLAEILTEHALSDAVLRKKLRMALAGAEGDGQMAAYRGA